MIRGRKAGIILQYSQEQLNALDELDKIIQDDFDRERLKLIKKKSIRVLKWDRRAGYNGDDFMQNMFSVLFQGRSYKIPRIIKKLLLK